MASAECVSSLQSIFYYKRERKNTINIYHVCLHCMVWLNGCTCMHYSFHCTHICTDYTTRETYKVFLSYVWVQRVHQTVYQFCMQGKCAYQIYCVWAKAKYFLSVSEIMFEIIITDWLTELIMGFPESF